MTWVLYSILHLLCVFEIIKAIYHHGSVDPSVSLAFKISSYFILKYKQFYFKIQTATRDKIIQTILHTSLLISLRTDSWKQNY